MAADGRDPARVGDAHRKLRRYGTPVRVGETLVIPEQDTEGALVALVHARPR